MSSSSALTFPETFGVCPSLWAGIGLSCDLQDSHGAVPWDPPKAMVLNVWTTSWGGAWLKGTGNHRAPTAGTQRERSFQPHLVGFYLRPQNGAHSLRVYRAPRTHLNLALLTQLKGVLTGTFILKSSLLNLKAMSERVLWKKPVGRRTRTSCRFAGKDACKTKEEPGAFAVCILGHATDLPLQLTETFALLWLKN